MTPYQSDNGARSVCCSPSPVRRKLWNGLPDERVVPPLRDARRTVRLHPANRLELICSVGKLQLLVAPD